MAIINKIRERSGVAVIVLTVGLALFILGGDLLSPNSSLMGGPDNTIGEIKGKDISYEEFNQEYEKVKFNFSLNTNRRPTEAEEPSLRKQAWDKLVFKYAYGEQFRQAGINISEQEIVDMIQGNNIHPALAGSFKKPGTEEVDKNAIIQYLQNLESYPPAQQAAFRSFEESLVPNRGKDKYDNLFKALSYVTDIEANREYHAQNTKASVNIVYVPYTTIADSTVKVTDAQLKAYYDKNKKDYEKPASVSIDYVSFPVVASPADDARVLKELSALAQPFTTSTNDTAYIAANSDGDNNITIQTFPELPEELKTAGPSALKIGDIYGPYKAGVSYVLYKVMGISQDSVYSAKASHILFKPVDGNWDAAKEKAEKILAEAKSPQAKFSDLALNHSDDGTRMKGGDLGWFSEGKMVTEFNNAVFGASSTGLIPNLIKSEYGYHIINVTGTKINTQYTIGQIMREVLPSDETNDKAYRLAARFAMDKNGKEFDNNDSSSVLKLQSHDILANALYFNNLSGGGARQIVRWAFNDDTKVGGVSEIVSFDDQYVVARLVSRYEEGIASLDRVKEDVTTKVKQEEKGKMMETKLAALKGKPLEEMAKAYGPQAMFKVADEVSMAAFSLQGVGFAPKTLGQIFAMKQGEVSAPIIDENGLVVVQVQKMEVAPETADYTVYKKQLKERRDQRLPSTIESVITDMYKVKDYTTKFY